MWQRKKHSQRSFFFLLSYAWGMIAVSFPKVANYDEWAKQLQAVRIIVNCPDEMDVTAMCDWMKRDETAEKQVECWKMVEKHMYLLGPIPRHIFDADEYGKRTKDAVRALRWTNIRDQGKYFTQRGGDQWCCGNPSQKLVKIVRAREKDEFEDFMNAPVCDYLGV
ncbi:putative retrotransposon hot spot (RHS) protein [Trypanosoma cruzi]|uniref:Putative retrotransposon hot spot (RHS) protein n=1 Tax=Trypanosoma cruzi TaxID=5693 RepID=A0A2V2W199_TRYCR|nr:putative retrotransposon hot spot (RHS) protein [Trypanosoma cruzi]